MFGGDDAIDVVLAKRFQSVKAFEVWKQSSAGQKTLRKYQHLKAKSLDDGGVIVWDDADDNGDFDAAREELVARNGYIIKRAPIGKGGVAKPRYQKRTKRSEWIADNGGGVAAYKAAQPVKPQSAYTIVLQLISSALKRVQGKPPRVELELAKTYYKALKPAVLDALYSKFQGVSRDEKFDKKLTGSPEFKILCIFGMPTLQTLAQELNQGQYAINGDNIARHLDRTISEPETMSKEAARGVVEYGLDERFLVAEIGAGAVAARAAERVAGESALNRELALQFLEPEPARPPPQFRQAITGPIAGPIAVASVPEVGSNVLGLEMDVE
jgi:hypothetical protein